MFEYLYLLPERGSHFDPFFANVRVCVCMSSLLLCDIYNKNPWDIIVQVQ